MYRSYGTLNNPDYIILPTFRPVWDGILVENKIEKYLSPVGGDTYLNFKTIINENPEFDCFY
ncbi:MAG: hypothetical protein PHD97_05100 [Bacteroidales bacterium]|nr:hypothetical protein [Bacteroidales bacterium]